MLISYYGIACFKMQVGDIVIAIDPYGKGVGSTPPRFEALAALITNPKANNSHSLAGDPYTFSTPGEYEIKDISIVGFSIKGVTPFFVEWENLHLLHLGELSSHTELDPILDYIDTVDVLFISTNGSVAEASKIVQKIDPRIIIPMDATPNKKSSQSAFLKEIGGKTEKMDKLNIKQKTLPQEGKRIVILDSAR